MNAPAPSPLLEARQVTFAYPNVPVFDRFSWSTDAALTLILGASGCGKTTLLRLLAGHIEPESGRVSVAQGPCRLVVQDDALFPWLSVDGNLRMSPDWQGWGEFTGPVARLAEFVAPLRRRKAAHLSFGQRRAVELLRVLVSEAKLLLLDEPLNFLDSAKRALVVECLHSRAEAGTTVVVTTHYDGDFRSDGIARFRFWADLPANSLKPE